MAAKKRQRTKSAAPYRVFVSHATYDKWIARVLCEKIEQIGIATFRDDRDIGGGDSIPDAIRDAIETSDEIVVLLSPDSVNRSWVLFEVAMAFAFRKRTVPLMFHVSFDEIPDIIQTDRGYTLDNLDNYLLDLKQRTTENV